MLFMVRHADAIDCLCNGLHGAVGIADQVFGANAAPPDSAFFTVNLKFGVVIKEVSGNFFVKWD